MSAWFSCQLSAVSYQQNTADGDREGLMVRPNLLVWRLKPSLRDEWVNGAMEFTGELGRKIECAV
jgi:hypothetical protein